MVQLNLALREINCKIVYFGCGLGGKTTNLEMVHEKADAANRGELTSIATESDRTLFFDFMPLDLGEISGMKVKFQLYTVPGQVYYNSTRKLVLRGADAVIFVADSQRSKMDENVESIDNLEECLKEQGRSLAEIPHVIQFNKRDLEDVNTLEELEAAINRHGAPTFEAVASDGIGVTETLKAAAAMLLDKVRAMSTDSAAKPDLMASRNAAAIRTPAQSARIATDRERLQGGLGHRTSGLQPVAPVTPPVEERPLRRTPQEAPRVEAAAAPAAPTPAARPVAARAKAPDPTGGAAPIVRANTATLARPQTQSVMISRSRRSGSRRGVMLMVVMAATFAAALAGFVLTR